MTLSIGDKVKVTATSGTYGGKLWWDLSGPRCIPDENGLVDAVVVEFHHNDDRKIIVKSFDCRQIVYIDAVSK